ncbi:coiled-coil domain-containing protein 9B isoform X2 [Bombina bombina]|uniref:coiled-coil domain-containing protein 9B isoform X2 n=1 Tax=Bombina bombina TaxID=8345 RepID=UPI00235AAB3B|nr:coiled-coil domain-containing protein 9B isoform X2 [Bombina bombina]
MIFFFLNQVTLSDGEIRQKEQKDAELDKKIQALRKKNEALIRRYQEIEEDKKNAEREAKAGTSQRPKMDSLTITITKTPNEKRVVNESWRESNIIDDEDDEHRFTLHMGNQMQLAVTMDSNVKGRRTVTKKTDQDSLEVTKALSDVTLEDTDHLFTYGRGRRMHIAITMEKEKEKRKKENSRMEPKKISEKEQIVKVVEKISNSDLTLTMTGRERIEYLRWKKEREQIDLERVARHKNSKGEWRRAWDMDKKENMFEDDLPVETFPSGYCGRRGDSGGKEIQIRQLVAQKKGVSGKQAETVPKTILAMGSKAQGKDRLTGRARRCDSMERSFASCVMDELNMEEHTDFEDKVPDPLTDRDMLILTKEKFKEEEKIVPESNLHILLPEKEVKKEMPSDLPTDGITVLEYLSVANNDREVTRFENRKGKQELEA